jgi:RHS repeat-associated protein
MQRAFLNIRLRLTTLLVLAVVLAQGQTGTPRTVPPAYNSNIQVNYVRTWDVVAPVTDANSLTMSTDPTTAKLTTAYIDGLARPLQTVVKKGSLITDPSNPQSATNAKDVIAAMEYDHFGREQFKYLPFASTANDGLFKTNPFQQQESFMQSQYISQGETFFYSQTNFETSPLNRAEKTMAAGNSWVGAANGGRGVSQKYWVNTSTDAVRIWNVQDNGVGSFGTYTSGINDIYPAGQLYKNITEDENGKQVIEFKDKEGKMILKKVELISSDPTGTGSGHSGWLCTYYIYDDLGQLRCVIQPEGVKTLDDPSKANWNLSYSSNILLNEQCFRYEYDERGRIIVKKVPGAAEVYMVYDARDRLIMTQDGNMRTGTVKWLVTKYDELNRPIATYLWENSTIASTHRNNAYNGTSYPSLSGNYETLTETFYDNYDWLSSQSGHGFTNALNTDEHLGNLLPASTTYPAPEALSKSEAVKGMVTGSKVKVLGTSDYLYTISFYDAKGRVIQVQSQTIGGKDIITTQYGFAGQPLLTIHKHQKTGTSALIQYILTKNNYDDLGRVTSVQKKVSNTLVNSGNMPSEFKTTVSMEYDALGQLKAKKIGTKPGVTPEEPLETLSYDYNIRGWMLGANRDYLLPDKNTNYKSRYFGFELSYDKKKSAVDNYSANTYLDDEFNGNIGGTVWKSKGDGQHRKYDFGYDAANRILKADFTQLESSNWTNTNVNFGVKMGDGLTPASAYDANGNILRMQQWGWKITGSTQVDDMVYDYYSNSNKLKKVTEQNGGLIAHNLGDFTDKNTSDDYGYDLNGNLVTDKNKKIGSVTGLDLTTGGAITYNHLNLPSLIDIKKDDGTDKGTITYTYNESGNKLNKVVLEKNVSTPNGLQEITTTTTYIGDFVYESKTYSPLYTGQTNYSDRLQFFSYEEGRVRYEFANPNTCPPTSDRFVWDYFIKDHLGNVRMVLTEQREPICYPAASVEDARQRVETQLYDIVNSRRIDKTTAGAGSQASFEDKVYQVHGGLTGQKTGLGIVLKVMAGDEVKISAESFYTMPGGGAGSPILMSVTELLTSLVSNSAVTGTHNGITTTAVGNIDANTSNLENFINQSAPSNTAKAYLNYILFDNQMKYISAGAEPVKDNGGYKLHSQFVNTPIPVAKSGYIYVFVSNESNLPVYFDNFAITHTPGVILEETHHYPFGLVMHGISSKRANIQVNKENTFQDQRFDNELDLNWVQFKWRNHDPQIGRFIEIDPLSEKYVYNSTYAFSENKVVAHIELEGLESIEFMTNWIIKKIIQGNVAVKGATEASVRLGTGQTDQPNTPAPEPIQNIQKTINKVNDINAVAQPAVQIYDIVSTIASIIPAGEAGAATGVTLGTFKGVGQGAGKVALNTEGNAIVSAMSKNPGIVKSFKNSAYELVELQYDINAYRVFGGGSGETGSFFGFAKPTSSANAEEMYYLINYGNDASFVTPVTIKKGTQVAIGLVEGGTGGQIYIPSWSQADNVIYWSNKTLALPKK